MGKHSSKFLLRLVLFSTLLGTFPVIALGVFSYDRSVQTTREKVNEGNQQILLQTQMRVEQLLKAVDNTATQLINTPIVHSAMDLPLDPRRFQMFNELLQGLYRLQTIELGIREVYFLNLKQNWAISSQKLSSIDELDNSDLLLRYVNEPRTSFWQIESRSETGGNRSGGRTSYTTVDIEGINLIKKLPIHSANPAGLLVVNVPLTEIGRLLAMNLDLGEFMVVDENLSIVAHSDPEQIGRRPQLALSGLNALSSNNEGHFRTRHVDEEVLVTYRKSPFNGWVYLSVASLREMSASSRVIGWTTLVTCLVIWVLTFLISMQGSRHMYSPIRRLYHFALGEDTTFQTSAGPPTTDEIHIISSRLQSLRRMQSNMAVQIQGQTRQLGDFFVLKLLLNGMTVKEIDEQLRSFEYPRHWRWMAVFLVQIDTLEGTRYEENDRDILMFAVNNMLGELIPENNRLGPLLIQQSSATVLGSDSADKEQLQRELFSRALNIQQAVRQYLHLQVSVGISRLYEDLSGSPKAFQESLEALRYRIQQGGEAILFMDNVLPTKPGPPVFPTETEAELLQAIKLTDRGQANASLSEFISKVFEKEASLNEYQISFMRLLVDIFRIVQENGESIETFHGDDGAAFDRLFALKSRQDMEKWFMLHIIEPTIAALEGSQVSNARHISERMRQLVHERFDSPLTLDVCAAHLNYHPNYIRQVFRKETGMNFSDYLSQYRMKMAKRWLEGTDMKISDIAQRLQYNNAQNFIRYFRKTEQVTPGQYREIVRGFRNL